MYNHLLTLVITVTASPAQSPLPAGTTLGQRDLDQPEATAGAIHPHKGVTESVVKTGTEKGGATALSASSPKIDAVVEVFIVIFT